MCEERVTSDVLSLLINLGSFRKTKEEIGSMSGLVIEGSVGPWPCLLPSNTGNTDALT